MRDKRTLEDRVLGVDAEGWTEHLLTQVWYEKGGMSYFTYKQEPRGYYVAVRLEQRKDGVSRFTMFSGGVKRHILGATRFSDKTLAGLVPDPAMVAEMQERMLAKRGAAA